MTYGTPDRHGTFYFRRIIPKALRPFMPAPWTGKSAWTKSLGTKEERKAKQPFARCLSDCEADFSLAERAMHCEPIQAPQSSPALPSDAEIEAEVLAGLLAADEQERLEPDPRQQFQTPDKRTQWPDLMKLKPRGMAEDYHYVLGGELKAQHAAYRKALARVDPEIVDGECRAFLRKHGLPIDPVSDAYHAVGLVILRAHVRAYDLLLQRHEGEPIETPAPPIPAAANKGPKLSEAFAAWKAGSGARGGKKPSDRTLLEATYAVRRLTEWHGDIRLGDFTRELARDFRDALATVPTWTRHATPSCSRSTILRQAQDEESQIQALERTRPSRPVTPGRPETQTHDYVRHGTTTLFAALNVLEGTVIGRCMQRHRHDEFLRFLNTIEAAVPEGKLIHVILDNYATHKHPKVRAWLAEPLRVFRRPVGLGQAAKGWSPTCA